MRRRESKIEKEKWRRRNREGDIEREIKSVRG